MYWSEVAADWNINIDIVGVDDDDEDDEVEWGRIIDDNSVVGYIRAGGR
jgi:hypothetical protein